MRKYLLASVATLLGAAAFATPALADVQVTGTIHKDETIIINEFIRKDKFVTIRVNQTFNGATAAESVSVYNQRTTGHTLRRDVSNVTTPTGQVDPNVLGAACLTAGCGPVVPADNVVTISTSFSDNIGVVMWNQDNGYNNNQANAVTAAVVANAFFAEATASAEQRTENNVSFVFGNRDLSEYRNATITTSVNRNVGVTFINQNVGFASNQYNSLTLAIGLSTTVALADADLGQWNQGNRTYDLQTTRSATISGSVQNNAGVTAINQNTGNFNNQATMISFAGGR